MCRGPYFASKNGCLIRHKNETLNLSLKLRNNYKWLRSEKVRNVVREKKSLLGSFSERIVACCWVAFKDIWRETQNFPVLITFSVSNQSVENLFI